ncbi:NAD(P)-dependent oxidoreductase [Coxiella burnetii]|uniref:NAD(P)-dependent oxidoreductase n=1 Tax=Coxiella burnetii TaxID=777 RepID=UPI0000DAE169|nr:NAD(P)-dependent oxidoreductase [Coxiella burnetii]
MRLSSFTGIGWSSHWLLFCVAIRSQTSFKVTRILASLAIASQKQSQVFSVPLFPRPWIAHELYRRPHRHKPPSSLFAPRHFSTSALPRLPVLDTMINKALAATNFLPLKKTVIVYIHHPLQTSVNLIEGFIRLGAKAQNIFVLGKHYSECQSVVEQMKQFGVFYRPCSIQIGLGKFSQNFTQDINWLWLNVMAHVEDKDVDEILILDHGGYALSFIPEQILRKYKVIGVEKTTAGLINLDAQGLPPFPLLGVANCAAKKILESPLIAEAIVKKLLPLIPIKENNLTCGVIGYGSIGKAITDKLLSMDHKVIVYDNDPNQLRSVNKMKNLATTNELPALVASSDYIFGCTGRDVATSIDSFRLSPKKKL